MSSYIPANMPQLSPYLTVKSPEESIKFYEEAFGFALVEAPAKGEDGAIAHVQMSLENAHIMFGPEGSYGFPNRTPATSGVPSSFQLYVYCKDVDSLYKQAMTAGAISMRQPEDMFWGDRMCALKDINGHEWCFATAKS